MATTFSFNMPYASTASGAARCRNCDTNLTANTPADQYQRLKIIQKTVRVPSSLYTMAVGSLSAYKQPTAATYGVCWNQQSDRPVPSVGRATVPTGTTSMAVSHKGGGYGWGGKSYTQTAARPGAQTPGGIGCDIKHNSYARRLNRLKAPLIKQQGVPVSFGGEIPFNLAYPVYGGKTMKTGIVAGCYCPPEEGAVLADLYKGRRFEAEEFDNIVVTLSVGEYVYAHYPGDLTCYSKAVIVGINGDGTFLIRFDNGTTDTQALSAMRMYNNTCDTATTTTTSLFAEGFINEIDNVFNENCIYPNNEYLQSLLA